MFHVMYLDPPECCRLSSDAARDGGLQNQAVSPHSGCLADNSKLLSQLLVDHPRIQSDARFP